MIPPRPHKRKYLFDPKAQESNETGMSDGITRQASAMHTSWKNDIRSGGSGLDFATLNERLAFAFHLRGEWVVLEFFEQHFVCRWLQRSTIDQFLIGMEQKMFEVIDENKKVFLSCWRHANEFSSYSIESEEKCVITCDFERDGRKAKEKALLFLGQTEKSGENLASVWVFSPPII